MSYPLILALSATILFSGCTLISQIMETSTGESQKKPMIEKDTTQKHKEIKNQNLSKDSHSSNIIKDKFNDYELTITQDANNLEGKYALERGQVSFAGARKEIVDSKLVIEKLGVNDFGYYYTIKLKGYPANEYFGIFSKKDGKYVKKIISDNGEISYYDNIELIHEDTRVKLTENTNNGKRIIIWKKTNFEDNDERLNGAKEIYNQVCKANYCEGL